MKIIARTLETTSTPPQDLAADNCLGTVRPGRTRAREVLPSGGKPDTAVSIIDSKSSARATRSASLMSAGLSMAGIASTSRSWTTRDHPFCARRFGGPMEVRCSRNDDLEGSVRMSSELHRLWRPPLFVKRN